MTVLLDTCVWGGARHDLESAGACGPRRPHAGDPRQGLRRVGRRARCSPHPGIVRLTGFQARQQGRVCAAILDAYGADLEAKALITVEPGRVRVRPQRFVSRQKSE